MLQHVALETPPADLDASVAFYALLGFAEVEAPDSLRGRSRWLERDGTQVHLLIAERASTAPHGHLAVVARDYEATMAALRAAGHTTEPRAEHWGSPRAFVRDPAGHLVEVMAAPPPTTR